MNGKKSSITRAYSYARWSSRQQRDGNSLERQLSAAKAYAEEHGLLLDRDMVDDAVSAYRGDNRLRGELARFRARIETGEIEQGSYLLIDSYDRFSREATTVSVQALLEIVNAGVVVVTLSNKAVFERGAEDATQRLMFAVMDLDRAHSESREKGRKVKKAHDAHKERARTEGRKWTPLAPSWISVSVNMDSGKRKFSFSPVPERVDLVNRVFCLYLDGISTTAIARMLNNEGVETNYRFWLRSMPLRLNGEPRKRTDKGQWSSDAVYAMLTSRAVLGEYQPHSIDRTVPGGRRPDDPPILGYYGDPIVDPEMFQRVQLSIRARRTAPRRVSPKAVRNLFAGIGRCRVCGGTFSLHSGTNFDNHRQKPRLRCVAAQTGGRCDNRRRYVYQDFEVAFLSAVAEFSIPDEVEAIDPIVGQLELAEIRLEELNARVDTAMLKAEADPTDERREQHYQGLRRQHALMTEEVRSLRLEVDHAQSERPKQEHQRDIAAFLSRMNSVQGDELFALRSKLSSAIRSIVSHIDFGPHGRATVWLKSSTSILYSYIEGKGFLYLDIDNSHGEFRAWSYGDAAGSS